MSSVEILVFGHFEKAGNILIKINWYLENSSLLHSTFFFILDDNSHVQLTLGGGVSMPSLICCNSAITRPM